MNTTPLLTLIYDNIKAAGEISHDAITRAYPHEDTPAAIWSLYMRDRIGLRSDGILYPKYN